MTGFVRDIVGETAGASTGPLRIVIAGAADTGILATCAHAVSSLGPDVAARVAYTVIDLCMTPLALCETFARRHGLSVDLHRADLCKMDITIPSDLVVLHSILSYLPATHHHATIRELRRWLKPRGRMLVSNRVRLAARRRPSDAEIVASYVDRCAARGVRCRPAEVVLGYLDQPTIDEAEFMHWDQIADTLVSSGLSIDREFRITREPSPQAGNKFQESRVTARYVAVTSAK
jgi:hypothetical protein